MYSSLLLKVSLGIMLNARSQTEQLPMPQSRLCELPGQANPGGEKGSGGRQGGDCELKATALYSLNVTWILPPLKTRFLGIAFHVQSPLPREKCP